MYIPENIITLILVKLHVKSLLRFRSVCKSWCDLIGSRRFIDLHLKQGSPNEYLVVKRFKNEDENSNTMLSFYGRDEDDDESFCKIAPDLDSFPPGMMYIIGPCNGIFLVGKNYRDDGRYCDNDEYPLYLCNPATHQFRKIPDRPFGRQRERPTRYSIGGPPFQCNRVSVGFGYDHRTNDYKVFSIMLFLEDRSYSGDFGPHGPVKIEIYDLSSNSWRVADTLFPLVNFYAQSFPNFAGNGSDLYDDLDMPSFWPCSLVHNGFIHWNSLQSKSILTLNISDEVMQAIQLLRAIFESRDQFDNDWGNDLFVLDDSLAFVHRDYPGRDRLDVTSFNIWVMMEYGDVESWMKMFHLEPEIHINVLTFWDDMLICETDEGDLASCNLRDDAHQFRRHNHIKRYDVSQKNKTTKPYRYSNTMGAIVIQQESLVCLSN